MRRNSGVQRSRTDKGGRLIVILGDQLSMQVAALKRGERGRDVVLMAEVNDEVTYVRHHKKKIAFVLSAMRHFAAELTAAGWTVDYVRLCDDGNTGSIPGEIQRALGRHHLTRVTVTESGEWRLARALDTLRESLPVPIDVLEDERFICSKDEFATWAEGRKQFRMETFYREMRCKTGLLMNGDSPVGGRWNYDRENRKPARSGLQVPKPVQFPPDETTREILHLVQDRFPDHFGELTPFWFGVTRGDAEAAFESFLDNSLAGFGDCQDAMLRSEPFLFHAVISLYLNVGLLDPLSVCRRVEEAYRRGSVPINAAEGFIRQIIGWREYVRGIYWQRMPDYAESNFLNHGRPLPEFYWTGETDMDCLRHAICQTRDEAYAHHIQRLMVTGNFAMLVGVDPKAIHEWYLSVYADAYEWVELPNTLGMSQFADGGLLATKPYAASGNYINRMSDYCAACRYDARKKLGSDACPFNYLYWGFLERHRGKLSTNPRLGPAYRTWDRMSRERQEDTKRDANRFRDSLLPKAPNTDQPG